MPGRSRRRSICRRRPDCFGAGRRHAAVRDGRMARRGVSAVGQPERWADLRRAQLERRRDNHVYIRSCRVFALTFAGAIDEATAAAEGLIEAGAATSNPYMHSFAIAASSFPPQHRGSVRGWTPSAGAGDRSRQRQSFQRDRFWRCSSGPPGGTRHAVTVDAFNLLLLSVRHYHDSGNLVSFRTPARCPQPRSGPNGTLEAGRDDRRIFAESALLRRRRQSSPPPSLTSATSSVTKAYELFARNGEGMSMADIVAYAM